MFPQQGHPQREPILINSFCAYLLSAAIRVMLFMPGPPIMKGHKTFQQIPPASFPKFLLRVIRTGVLE